MLASDGLATRWTLESYPGLSARDPALVAGVLYRDHSRRRDDVTVVVAREPRRVSLRLLTVRIRQEQDVVAARQRARQLARLLGFDEQDQVRIATAVSELARNVYNYAREGEVEFAIEGQTPPQVLVVRVSDQGPGIADVDLILSGRYRSTTGMGLGILGARRLMDRFAIQSEAGQGTTITIQKLLPAARRPSCRPGTWGGCRRSWPGRACRTRWPRCSSRTRSSCASWTTCAAARRTSSASTASWRTRTAAWSPSTPSWTRRPSTCGAPTR